MKSILRRMFGLSELPQPSSPVSDSRPSRVTSAPIHPVRVELTGRAVAVVVSATAPPKLHALLEEPSLKLKLDGVQYKDAGLEDWIGFYDWLRTPDREVIGVRLGLDTSNSHLMNLKGYMNVFFTNSNDELSIYFGDERTFERAISIDQDFGSNRLLVAAGSSALTFNAPTPIQA